MSDFLNRDPQLLDLLTTVPLHPGKSLVVAAAIVIVVVVAIYALCTS